MLGLLAASKLWTWVINIGSSLLVFVGMQSEPNPYENIGYVCIALVFLYVVAQTFRQSRRLMTAIKTRKEV